MGGREKEEGTEKTDAFFPPRPWAPRDLIFNLIAVVSQPAVRVLAWEGGEERRVKGHLRDVVAVEPGLGGRVHELDGAPAGHFGGVDRGHGVLGNDAPHQEAQTDDDRSRQHTYIICVCCALSFF